MCYKYTVITIPQPLAPNESDSYRVVIARNLAMLEAHRLEIPTNKGPIEEARQTLTRLSDADRLTTDDREFVEITLHRLSELGLPVIAKVNR